MFFSSLREKWAKAREEEQKREEIETLNKALVTLAANGDAQSVDQFLTSHDEKILPDTLGFALIGAAERNNSELIQVLVSHGADVNFDKGTRDITSQRRDSQG